MKNIVNDYIKQGFINIYLDADTNTILLEKLEETLTQKFVEFQSLEDAEKFIEIFSEHWLSI